MILHLSWARRWLARTCLAAGLASAVSAPTAADGPPQGFVVHDAPRALPEVSFRDADGDTVRLADFRGRTVLLNVWATWCTPCREEMPTLDRLQAELGGPDFAVVALSIDRAGADVVGAFFDEIGIEHLAIHVDASGRASRQLSVVGLPSTLLLDAEGREVGRLVGPAAWNAPAMIRFLRDRIARDAAVGQARSRNVAAALRRGSTPPDFLTFQSWEGGR